MDTNIKEILSLLEENYPRVGSMLNFNNPFQLMVATILSAQTNDEQVNKATKKLFARVTGPQDLARLQPEQLEPYLAGCGLYRKKSRYLIDTCQEVVDKYGGKVPRRFEDLVMLPGVGRKTANVILSAGFGIPAMAVDTHVYRVARKLGLAKSTTPAGVERELTEKLPAEGWLDFHRRLITHGRRVCKARSPQCGQCFLKDYCPSAGGKLDRKERDDGPDKIISKGT